MCYLTFAFYVLVLRECVSSDAGNAEMNTPSIRISYVELYITAGWWKIMFLRLEKQRLNYKRVWKDMNPRIFSSQEKPPEKNHMQIYL